MTTQTRFARFRGHITCFTLGIYLLYATPQKQRICIYKPAAHYFWESQGVNFSLNVPHGFKLWGKFNMNNLTISTVLNQKWKSQTGIERGFKAIGLNHHTNLVSWKLLVVAALLEKQEEDARGRRRSSTIAVVAAALQPSLLLLLLLPLLLLLNVS